MAFHGTLTCRDLGQRLQLGRQAIMRAVAAGQIPRPLRIGRTTRWPVRVIEAWENEQAGDASQATTDEASH